MTFLGRFLVVTGLVLAGLGVLLMFSDRIPLVGKLPGDIHVKRDNFQFYFPLTSSILVSVVLSLVVWLVSYFSKR